MSEVRSGRRPRWVPRGLTVPRRLRVPAVVIAVVAAVAAGMAARPEPVVRTEDLRLPGVPEAGRPVELDTRIYRPPTGSGPWPAVMLAHGYGSTRESMDGEARQLARAGYLVLAWTARGFGRSGGLVHLDAPDYEVADARLVLDALAARADVQREGSGEDPVVGVSGGSYGGALSLLLAGTDPRIDAVGAQITWNDLRRALFPQSVLPAGPLPVGSQVAGGTAGGVATAAAPPAPASDVATSGVFKKAWAGVFFGPGRGDASASLAAALGGEPSRAASAAPSGSAALCGRLAPDLCQGYLEVARTGRPTQQILDLLAASSPARVLDAITAPTLIVQGSVDSLFPLGEGDANAAGIAANGTPVKVVWTAGGHDGGVDESERLRAITLAWFDRHLRGIAGPDGADTRFEATVPAAAISSQDSGLEPMVRAAPGAPGVNPDAEPVAWQRLRLTGREQTIVSPAGGWPAAVTSLPGVGGGTSLSAVAGSLATLPGQSATFDSAPLTDTVRLVGAGRVELRVWSSTRDATLFVSVQDVSPYGTVRIPGRLVAPVRITDIGPGGARVTVQLPAALRDLQAGHRLRVAVSATDQAFALPADGRTYRVALTEAAPEPPGQNGAGQNGGGQNGGGGAEGAAGAARPPLTAGEVAVPTVAMTVLDAAGLTRLLPWAFGLAGATVLVIGIGLWRRRRVALAAPSAELTDVPLAIVGLAKTYANGYRAVRDVSFRVERGMVLGLLGPNGAGKTTVLRMAMGLIHPTAGQIRVFGHQVRPGSPVLSRLGAFVEGPGFLPHVSGWENLRLYWAATGRPLDQAYLDEALEVAGLGQDVHRTVRTYSQGMRQRLAIAQAMLGLPDLLVLDEPTNGLDPPQIREMREVLMRYAATGRTVLVSSHLLSEVEQTCSHVVVMHHGEVVASGVVADLVGSATALVVDIGGSEGGQAGRERVIARAGDVAASVPGAREVTTTASGLTLELIGTPRAVLVRALVEAGLEVERVAPRRGLEEAFLALIGEEAADA